MYIATHNSLDIHCLLVCSRNGSTSAETLPPQPLHVPRLLPFILPVRRFNCRGFPTKRARIGEPHDVTPSRRAQPCLWRHPLLHVATLFGKTSEWTVRAAARLRGWIFVLNDVSACVLARNVLFLYLCLQMSEYGSQKLEREWLEWIASVWAIWYNHELGPLHSHVFTSALEQLLEWSETPSRWERCQLGKIVSFSSLTTFNEIKNAWAL